MCSNEQRHAPYYSPLNVKSVKVLQNYEKQNAYFGYFDETWVFEGMVSRKAWQIRDSDMYQKARLVCTENPVPDSKKGASRGKRGIVVAVITEDGILKETENVYISGCKFKKQKEDYQTEMTADLYEKMTMETIIPQLARAAAAKGRPAVLVKDNASYHCRIFEKAPTKQDHKKVIVDFWAKHGIVTLIAMHKAQLVEKMEELIKLKGGRRAIKKSAFLRSFSAKNAAVLFRHVYNYKPDVFVILRNMKHYKNQEREDEEDSQDLCEMDENAI
uniref:Tc1-like transposase DDE domain-containing protein n=1 Tax=Caenorhabditis japonica TaxID=281687 RepID=A0A8R1HUY5_CAEJA